MDNLVSLAMIVKNEEVFLSRCLESVKNFVDEIIIVDTGSTDLTKFIAGQYTDKIYDFLWCDDFAKARNFAFSQASCKYVLWLDADDYVSPENLEKLINLRSRMALEDVDVFMLKYETAFDSQGNATFAFNRERILKNDGTFFWEGAVHEVITPHGKVENVDIAIKHLKGDKKTDAKRNLKIYRKIIREGKKLTAREKYYYARELYYNQYYKKAIKVFNEFLDDKEGWIENNLGALEMIYFCKLALKDDKNILKILYVSFEFDTPRANFLCYIGDYFMLKNKFKQAIFWFENALKCEENYSNGAFVNPDFYNVYPALQLCVCYYNLGDIQKSKNYNDFVLTLNPQNGIAIENDMFFKNVT